MKRKQENNGNLSGKVMKKPYQWMPTGLLMFAIFIFMKASFVSQAIAGTVSAESINIRSNANAVSTVLGSALKGSTVDIIGKVSAADGYVWYQIYVDADTKGFVRSDLISTTATIPDITVTTAETTQIATIIANGVWVRDQAATTGALLTSLSKGMNVTLLGTSGDWSHVNFVSNGTLIDGYIWADYIQAGDIDTTEATTTTTETTTNTTETTTNTTDTTTDTADTTEATDTAATDTTAYVERGGVASKNGVRVREAATTTSEMIGSVDSGDAVRVIGEETASDGSLWYQVRFTFQGSEITGFILSDFLVVEEVVVEEPVVEEPVVEEPVVETPVTEETDSIDVVAEEDGSLTLVKEEETETGQKTFMWIIEILILVIIIGTFVYLRLTDYVDNKDSEKYQKKIKKVNGKSKKVAVSQQSKIIPSHKNKERVPVLADIQDDDQDEEQDDEDEMVTTGKKKEISYDEKEAKITSIGNYVQEEEDDMELLFLHSENFE